MKTQVRHAGAFTLIEVMMVVAIIGLTMTMGLPSFVRAIKREGIGKAERDFVKACQDARQAAIMKNQRVDLVIRPLDKTFSVPGVFEAVEIPSSVKIEILGINFVELEGAEEARVHFNPNSTSDEFTMILYAVNGRYVRIDLDSVTALTVVKDLR
jgi:prepilin-type N-terminal cleavage/methylation domain-containing protein